MDETMTDARQRILDIVKAKGPILPVDIAREIKSNTILVGAMLSELASKKMLKISHVKVGGSPLYYTESQEAKLEIGYKSLHEKEKKAYDLLKKNSVLKDADQTPLMRVSLRNIKDFAKPLEVTVDEETQIFWKWYLLPMEDATGLIKDFLKNEKTSGVKKKTRFGKKGEKKAPSKRSRKKKSLSKRPKIQKTAHKQKKSLKKEVQKKKPRKVSSSPKNQDKKKPKRQLKKKRQSLKKKKRSSLKSLFKKVGLKKIKKSRNQKKKSPLKKKNRKKK